MTEQTVPQHPRVVVGVDGSPGARAALVYAFAAAIRRRADLEVVAAYPVTLPWAGGASVDVPAMAAIRADAEARAAAFLAEVRADLAGATPGMDDVPVRLTVDGGPAAQILVDRAADAELLIVGSRGRGAVRSALLGSVALHCATHAHCPVAVVHGTTEAPDATDRVVVGVDGSEASQASLRAGVVEAARLGTAVDAVAAYSLDDYWTGWFPVDLSPLIDVEAGVRGRAEKAVQAVLADLAPELGDRLPDVRVDVVEGPASDVLIERGRTAQLLVVGSRGHGSIRGLLLGSVALRCAMHAACPVLLVPPASGRAAPAPRTPAPEEQTVG